MIYVPPTGSPADGSLEKLESPKISIGKADTVIQVLPTALRFWEKLGLGPRGGKKDLTAFVLFEDDGEEKYDQLEAWLANISEIYAVRSNHSPSCCLFFSSYFVIEQTLWYLGTWKLQ